MKAARLIDGAVTVVDAPTPEPGVDQVLVRVTAAGVCHSDLHLARGDWAAVGTDGERPLGHEAIGVVEDVGSEVQQIRRGQLVVMPFAYSDGSCPICHEGVHTACPSGGFFGSWEVGGRPRRCASRKPTARSIRSMSGRTTR